ncbi:hypothetical protein QS306_05150 [Paraburkholderia bonniea]|uniref:hypothetical protein n=1 Tax=Paraburkholderia bonniea TaxID=2152891 RepID=UPI0012917344|nr:hypothetical protein [Paraburkholderia bonniea]WJF91041.1 hypothetical protein QS306_05150 [Paraburkholderia bonniea]WJF94355.1 hypothetical protein QS308_05155 [Paraburkholderia bonniea]
MKKLLKNLHVNHVKKPVRLQAMQCNAMRHDDEDNINISVPGPSHEKALAMPD